MLESKLQRKCRDIWAERGGRSIKITSQGERGFPDVLFLAPGGEVMFVEFKQPGGVTSPKQRIWLWTLTTMGYKVLIIDSVEMFSRAVS